MSTSANSKKVILIALFANLGIALAKFIGAFISHSASLLAESIHSAVDCANQLLLLVGNNKSKKSPTKLHPLGYGREAFFWSFIVAILLFSLGGVFAIYEGIHKLSEKNSIEAPYLGIAILVISLALEGYSFKACIHEVKQQNKFGSLWKWFRNTTSSELLVIFTEDAAALLGLILALTSLIISWLTNNAMWDALGSILIGTVLVTVAVLLAIEIKSLIIGEAPETDFRSFIDEQLNLHLPGGKIFNLIALQIGADEVMLSCKFHPGEIKDLKKLIETTNLIEKELKNKFPEVKWQFFEPDYVD